METAINKLNGLLELVDIESINELNEALEAILSKGKQTKVKLKIGYALANENEPGNYLSLDFKIDK